MEKPSGHQVPCRVWLLYSREAIVAGHALWMAGFRAVVAYHLGKP